MLGSAWLKSVVRVLTDYGSMTMEFKLGGKKRVWKALLSKEIQQCEANMMKKLYRSSAYYFAIVLTNTNQVGMMGSTVKRSKKNCSNYLLP